MAVSTSPKRAISRLLTGPSEPADAQRAQQVLVQLEPDRVVAVEQGLGEPLDVAGAAPAPTAFAEPLGVPAEAHEGAGQLGQDRLDVVVHAGEAGHDARRRRRRRCGR